MPRKVARLAKVEPCSPALSGIEYNVFVHLARRLVLECDRLAGVGNAAERASRLPSLPAISNNSFNMSQRRPQLRVDLRCGFEVRQCLRRTIQAFEQRHPPVEMGFGGCPVDKQGRDPRLSAGVLLGGKTWESLIYSLNHQTRRLPNNCSERDRRNCGGVRWGRRVPRPRLPGIRCRGSFVSISWAFSSRDGPGRVPSGPKGCGACGLEPCAGGI